MSTPLVKVNAMLTKKDFIVIEEKLGAFADVVRVLNEKKELPNSRFDTFYFQLLKDLALTFKKTNPRFNTERFINQSMSLKGKDNAVE